ncbi:MAG TPA: M28 family metallopeptidase [Terracidiphilus sp.]|jgi:N-acetylated-alpha-linked acidic dipeptidase|nr:M28 family metallopeptidase [Terracidiphilus sp.]
MLIRKSPVVFLLFALVPDPNATRSAAQAAAPSAFGYTDFAKEAALETKFLDVPNAKLAGEELRTLTAEPHMAATPEDHKTAEYVAEKFRAAGLETEIVPFRVLLNQPKVVTVEAYDAAGKLLMSGPTREHAQGDPTQDDPRVVMPFNGSSGSGDVTGEVVYANYGRLEDFDQLAAQHIDLHGKIVIVRYGGNFRGVKVYIAEQRGAAGVLIYSDPQDDGYFKGDAYPAGPWRPETGVQRGSVQYLFKYPGDPETPGVASTPDLPDSSRISPDGNQPHIISIPISYHDASPILQALKGSGVPQGWQGALPFRYHLGAASGAGSVRAHLVSQQDYQRRTIWDVVGKIKGTEFPDEWVVNGNHRDAWVYGAVDPNSGTAVMLEAAHGIGALLKEGWRPKRTILFCSWDAEEEGLIGSTEWVEQHAQTIDHAVAYFNTDVGVAGPDFNAAAVPSLKQFVRDVTKSVPSPISGTVYQEWRLNRDKGDEHRGSNAPLQPGEEVRVSDLGSGSDFTPFLQHAGVPSTDVGSSGPYGVYHSTFDDYAWFVMNADPRFVYLQEMARVFGLEALRMADADVLPYDYPAYAREISSYIDSAKRKAGDAGISSVDFAAAQAAASRFTSAAAKVHSVQTKASGDTTRLNHALRQAETDLLLPNGLPNRPWYKHSIYAPGEFTGYAAVVIPGVNEAIDAKDAPRASQQLTVLTQALDRAAQTLDSAE